MILESARRNFINKLRLTNSLPDKHFTIDGVNEIGVLVDIAVFKNTDSFKTIPQVLGVPDAKLTILGYAGRKSKDQEYSIDVFFKKDVNNFGKLKNDKLTGFTNHDFDLLINYYSEEKYPLKLVSAYCKASLKVGFSGVDPVSNDLILNCDIQNDQLFFQLLSSYIKVIKK